MTWALCLNCGKVKFGAICPCFECGASSTGDMGLDIAFSDHHLSKESLEALGGVVAAIHQASDDKDLCFWSFIRYISVNHPSILGVELSPERLVKCDALLERANIPLVELPPEERGT